MAIREAAALVSAEVLAPDEERGEPAEDDDADDELPDFAIWFSSALAYWSAGLFSYSSLRPSTFCFARYAMYAQLPMASTPMNMKNARIPTITFTAPPPDFCGAAVATAGVGVTLAVTAELAGTPAAAPTAAPCTAIPHFAQNFVSALKGLPHPTQNFFSGSAAATHFVPHEEQKACASPSDAPQALHVFAI